MIWPLGNMHVLMFQAIKPFHILRCFEGCNGAAMVWMMDEFVKSVEDVGH